MNDLALVPKQDSLANQTAKELSITPSYVQLVKDTFAKGATDDELSLFLRTAHRTGLDPMARQLFVVKRYDSNLRREVMSIQISIDGFRLIADRTNRYVPSRETSYTFDKNGQLQSATAYIKKLVAGTWHEVSATAFYSEYVQTTKENKPNRMWQKMPRLMLGKCAESLVLRKAFPAELSGLYTPEEMGNEPPAAVPTFPAELENEIRQTEFEVYQEEKGLTVDAEPEVLTDPHDGWNDEQRTLYFAYSDQLQAHCEFLNFSADKLNNTIYKFSQFRTIAECEAGLEKVAAAVQEKKTEKIMDGIANQNWDEEEIESYLGQFEIKGVNDATRAQIDAVYADMLDAKMIN